MYQLPHTLLLLFNPPVKLQFKKLVKAKVVDYWEKKLRAEAAFLPSLVFFNPYFLSLTTPHKLLTYAGPNSYEVSNSTSFPKF